MKRLIPFFLSLLVVVTPISAQQSRTWFYVATSVDSNGDESAFSNQVQATVSAAHPTVDLSWVASTTPGVTYNVYRTAVSGSGYVKMNATPISTLTFTDTTAFPSPPTMNTPSVP